MRLVLEAKGAVVLQQLDLLVLAVVPVDVLLD
jgi:hypothetical protein